MATHPISAATRAWTAAPIPFRIGGKPVTGERQRALVHPGDGAPFATVGVGDAGDVDRAVAAARQALPGWAAVNAAARARLMWRLAERIDAHAGELAELESLCMGKPFHAGLRAEVPFFAETFRYYAGWCTKIAGMAAPLSFPVGDMHGLTLREPVGVVGMILPWNGPLVIGGWKIAPALAAGCTCVVKPADIAPLSLLRFAELAAEAGLPDGVLNIVTGAGATVGAALAAHPDIDKLAFTGSGPVGRSLVQAAADSNLKTLTLELGGKSPVLVFPDADPDAAVAGAANAIFGNAGQVCVAGSRLYVHNDIRPRITERLLAHAAGLRVGDPFDDRTDLGPIASQAHCDTIARRVEAGCAAGAEVLCGGRPLTGSGGRPGSGSWFPPTILYVPDQANPLVQEEIFGPVLVIAGFDSEAEAIALANGTGYSLAGSVWTRDIDRALRVTRALRAGIVWINTHNIPDLNMPVGGYGQSGWGRELGEQGLAAYLQTKSVMIDIAGNRDD